MKLTHRPRIASTTIKISKPISRSILSNLFKTIQRIGAGSKRKSPPPFVCELNCDELPILITFIYIITPLLTSTHKPVPTTLVISKDWIFFACGRFLHRALSTLLYHFTVNLYVNITLLAPFSWATELSYQDCQCPIDYRHNVHCPLDVPSQHYVRGGFLPNRGTL